ncbi:MAG: metallophosphoesterase [Myxococcota bacterium]|nr:metallophosphoesterase [Myxococcota bacterium]
MFRPIAVSLFVLGFAGPAASGPVIEAAAPAGKAPWTGLAPRDEDSDFRFVVVSDRTGEHRPGVFAAAMEKIDRLEPAFVVSVGDLIEGYTEDRGELRDQWDEIDGYVGGLRAPFFYAAGNHDFSNEVMSNVWRERYGPSFYDFWYKDVHFVVLNSELFSAVGSRGKSIPGPDTQAAQMEWVERVLTQDRKARWTFVLVHQPLWDYGRRVHPGWLRVEELLGDRPYTVFAGHLHEYTAVTRNDRRYITLATTGGGSPLRGIDHGEFDHVALVTVTGEGPVITNLLLDGIQGPDVRTAAGRGAMRQLEGALSVEPLVQAGETFTVGKARFHVANTGKAVLEVQGAFEGNDQFSPAPESVSAEVLPGRDVSFEVDLRAPSPVPFSELQPGVARWTLRTTQADGTPVEHSQTSWLLPEKRFACVPVSETIAVDGALEDWGQLRFPVPRRPGEESGSGVSFAFDVRCDDATVYVGIVVRDPSLFLSPNEIGRHQDGISVVFDARPDPERSENQHFFAAAMSGATRKMIIAPLAPVQPKPDPVFDKFIGPVPDSVRRAARRTPGGYAAELAIPVAVLDERQGRPWDAFRMNVSVQDFDAEGNHVGTVWWRPSRMGLSTTPISGSGTFVRAAE